MNLPVTLNSCKGAVKVETAAELLAEAARLLDSAETDFRGTDFAGEIEKIPGTRDVCNLMAERLTHLATRVFDAEGVQ
jgi:hypothetical protein